MLAEYVEKTFIMSTKRTPSCAMYGWPTAPHTRMLALMMDESWRAVSGLSSAAELAAACVMICCHVRLGRTRSWPTSCCWMFTSVCAAMISPTAS